MTEKKDYWFTVGSTLFAIEGLTQTDKLIIALVVNLSKKDGKCFMSRKNIAKCINANEDTVAKSERKLQQNGYIKIAHKHDETGNIVGRELFPTNKAQRIFEGWGKLPQGGDKLPQGSGQIPRLGGGKLPNIYKNNDNKPLYKAEKEKTDPTATYDISAFDKWLDEKD